MGVCPGSPLWCVCALCPPFSLFSVFFVALFSMHTSRARIVDIDNNEISRLKVLSAQVYILLVNIHHGTQICKFHTKFTRTPI